jgi:hypothetical protein
MPEDYRGAPLTEGATVAFNYSGEVKIGTIVKVSETNRYGRRGHLFHVRHPYGVSKVTNKNNLVVINEQE